MHFNELVATHFISYACTRIECHELSCQWTLFICHPEAGGFLITESYWKIIISSSLLNFAYCLALEGFLECIGVVGLLGR